VRQLVRASAVPESPRAVAAAKRHTADLTVLVGPGVNAGMAVLLLMLGTLAGRRLRR
jgi:hypothetical protein